jgi:lipoate-protein ligase A
MPPIRVEVRNTPAPFHEDASRIEALADAGPDGDVVRIYRPEPVVCFGPRDLAAPGYAGAVEAARAHGFDVAERRPGGRAMAFHEQTLILDWLAYDGEPRRGLHQRFEELATIVRDALRDLGLDARIGELPGEYCPGQYSINIGGERKVAGLAQRIYPHAAHIGAAVVVGEESRLREVLVSVYEALCTAWEPGTLGGIGADATVVSWDDAAGAFVAEFARRLEARE